MGRGEGPGELIGPKAVEVSGPEVHVLDAWNHHITRYEMGPATLRHTGQTRLPTSGGWESFLFDGDYIILNYERTRGGSTIHRFDRAGNVKLSFGVPFLQEDAECGGGSGRYWNCPWLRDPRSNSAPSV